MASPIFHQSYFKTVDTRTGPFTSVTASPKLLMEFPVPTYWSKSLGWESISSSWHSILVGIHTILLIGLQTIFQHMDFQEKLHNFLSLPARCPHAWLSQAMLSKKPGPLRPHSKSSLYRPLSAAGILPEGSCINLQNRDYPPPRTSLCRTPDGQPSTVFHKGRELLTCQTSPEAELRSSDALSISAAACVEASRQKIGGLFNIAGQGTAGSEDTQYTLSSLFLIIILFRDELAK